MTSPQPHRSGYRPPALILHDLQLATSDLDLTEAEQGFLRWMTGWDNDTVAHFISILHKARRGSLEPPMPEWIERYL